LKAGFAPRFPRSGNDASEEILDSCGKHLRTGDGKGRLPWLASNSSIVSVTWPNAPGWMSIFRFLPKPRPKRRRKPSDVSGLPLSPRLGWGQEPVVMTMVPPFAQEERRERELEKWVSKLQ
jgi:hypothetical protein